MGFLHYDHIERIEIVIEGSDDGYEWKEYCFKYKPSEVSRLHEEFHLINHAWIGKPGSFPLAIFHPKPGLNLFFIIY